MKEIVFNITPCEESGFTAAWDAPEGGGITTQGDDLAELQFMVKDAIEAYFDVSDTARPSRFRLHFQEDPAFAFA